MQHLRRRAAIAGAGAALLSTKTPRAQALDPWPSLASQIFEDRPLQDGSTVLSIEAPYRAEDAAVVPVTLRWTMPDGDARVVRKVTLVVDANPSPVAGVFTVAEGSGVDMLSTRLRIDDYTNVHAVAELSDGALLVSARFVKAAGGCSAPALKQTADAIPLGTMRVRAFPTDPGLAPGRREAQILVRHPNYSGMQMDQVTRLYIPAHFLSSLQLWQGDDPLFAVEGGISISENPAFRFDYKPNGATAFRVEARDSDGQRFAASFPTDPRAS